MSYDEMEAGPEMDRRVAERVMGWAGISIVGTVDGYTVCVVRELHGCAFRPSERMTDAWPVAERLRLMVFPCKDGWAAAIPYDADGEGPAHGGHWIDDSLSHYAEADTAALAICRCALMAMEKKG